MVDENEKDNEDILVSNDMVHNITDFENLTYGCEIAGYDFELSHSADHNNQIITGLCGIIRGLETRIEELEEHNGLN